MTIAKPLEAATERPTRYEYDELLACGRGELFGPGNAQLPLRKILDILRALC